MTTRHPPGKSMNEPKNEFHLLTTRRFLPLFVTQFLGAFNDNLYKTALIMLIAFNNNFTFLSPDTLINICAGLFILPFFLFSALAGQLADKYEKSKLIIATKWIEVLLACLVVLGFYINHFLILLISLFLLGTQATFFGPLKYSILPQHLKPSELLGGNGFIEMGTFIAILLGTIVGGFLIAVPTLGKEWVSLVMVMVSLLGLFSSFWIPKAQTFVPELKIELNIFRETFLLMKRIYQHPILFFAVMGISWFWFFGSIFLSQTPNFTRLYLHGNETLATLLLTSFSLGIGVGSLSCEWLTHKKIDMDWVLLGLSGLTLFAMDLSLIPYLSHSSISLQGTQESWLEYWHKGRVLMDGFLMGMSSGIYLVPLYTLIQKKSSTEERSRVIAGNNVINALMMVLASLFAIVFLKLITIPQLFMITAILNIPLSLYLNKIKKFL